MPIRGQAQLRGPGAEAVAAAPGADGAACNPLRDCLHEAIRLAPVSRAEPQVREPQGGKRRGRYQLRKQRRHDRRHVQRVRHVHDSRQLGVDDDEVRSETGGDAPSVFQHFLLQRSHATGQADDRAQGADQTAHPFQAGTTLQRGHQLHEAVAHVAVGQPVRAHEISERGAGTQGHLVTRGDKALPERDIGLDIAARADGDEQDFQDDPPDLPAMISRWHLAAGWRLPGRATMQPAGLSPGPPCQAPIPVPCDGTAAGT